MLHHGSAWQEELESVQGFVQGASLKGQKCREYWCSQSAGTVGRGSRPRGIEKEGDYTCKARCREGLEAS